VRLLFVLALVGCTHEVVTVAPLNVARRSGDLRAHEHASLYMEPNGYRALSLHDRVDARLAEPDRRIKISIAELLAECPPTASFSVDEATRLAYPRCVLLQTTAPLVVVDRKHVDGDKVKGWTALTIFALAEAGIIACAAACDSPGKYIADGALVVEGIVVVVGAYAFAKALGNMGRH
jgi:hypothetical protein